MRVNSSRSSRTRHWLAFLWAVAWLSIPGVGAPAQEKKIHLRNESISTPPRTATAIQPQITSTISSGLFLVQFADRLQPAWREELRQMRVELLRYVPDDAFVARFDAVDLAQVTRLSFVQWIGPY